MFEQYRITSYYAKRKSPIDGKDENHRGIDLVKREGGKNAPIETFVAGRVVHAGLGKTGTGFGGYGNVVAVLHDEGGKKSLHCYCHLSKILVQVGENVSRGTIIGLQGTTGKSTGEHLHYEIRTKAQAGVPFGFGSDVNPLKWWEGREEYMALSKEDGEKIVKILGNVWQLQQDDKGREEIHRLADEVRKDAGIPIQE